MRIAWTKLAVADLDRTPKRHQYRIVAAVRLLGEFPLMGSAMDGAFKGFRQIVVAPFRIIYQVGRHEVVIAYIRHGARQPGLRIVRSEDD